MAGEQQVSEQSSNSGHHLGIRGKFFLLVFPVTAFFVIVFTALVVELSNIQREEQNRQLAESIGRRDAELLAPVLWNIDFEGQRRIIEVIGNEKRLRCLHLYETGGNSDGGRVLLTKTGDCEALGSACQDISSADGEAACRSDSVYRVSTPIVHRIGTREYPVGLAYHWVDISRERADVLKEIIGFSALSLIMYVVLSVCISIGFRRVVFRPIKAMDVSLKNYDRTGVRERVNWSGSDELGQIILAYNDSVDRQNRVEKELMLARDEAQKALDELRVAKDNLVQAEKLASLGSLVAGIAHEINTPVGSSLTVATTLGERVRQFRELMASGALRKSELDDFIEQTDEASQILGLSLQAAAEQIQKFKQVAVDQTSTNRRRFNLGVVIEEVLSTLRPRIKRTQVELEVEIDPDIWMDSYPGPLGQVISNLFTNALLHGFEDNGEGCISIRATHGPGETVVLVFSDDGVGMNPNQLKRLYDPFFTTRMGQGGSGLGMHVVYNLVTTVLGGEINVDSRIGEGTRVTMKMSLKAPDRPGSDEEKPE